MGADIPIVHIVFCQLLVYNKIYNTNDWKDIIMDSNKIKLGNFSKDNPVVEISSKQGIVQTQNVVVPERPKEIKKE